MEAASAEETARSLLCQLPQRLSHVAAVACLAQDVAARAKIDADVLVSAAWLHDVGYAPEVIETGFHPLDGARFLRGEGVPERVVNLVAHHSIARIEADVRGLRLVLEAEFPFDDGLPHDLLCYCDMTTGPSGERVSVGERLREIRERYGPDDLVTEFIGLAEKDLVGTVERIEKRLAEVAQSK